MDSDQKENSAAKAKVVFKKPGQGDEVEKTVTEVRAGSKILVAAIKNKVDIRYGCAVCRCGTCGVAVSFDAQDSKLSEIASTEQKLLEKMELPLDGSVRLACQARVLEGSVDVDLAYQDTYSPDDGADDEDEYYDDEY
jgi:ferredoxin